MNMISWSCSVHLNGIIQLLCSNNYPALKNHPQVAELGVPGNLFAIKVKAGG